MDARRTGSRLFATSAALTAVVLLAGCGGGEVPNQASDMTRNVAPSTTSSALPHSEPSSSTTTSPTKRPSPTAATLCESSDLELSLGRGDGAAGTVWRPLRFTNVSDSPCVIQGFPGVSYVAGEDGHQVGAAAYRDGKKGAPVTLSEGETAFSAVGFTQVANYDPDDCEPTKVRGLRVYPPQETHSMYLARSATGCANEDLQGGYQLKVQTVRPGPGPT